MSPNDMLGAVVRSLVGLDTKHHGVVRDAINKLKGERGDAVHTRIAEALREPTDRKVESKLAPLLKQISTINVPAATETFILREKLVVNTAPDASVAISGIGQNFQNWFLSGKGVIEPPFAGSTLAYDHLGKRSVDGPIISALGGLQKVRTSFTEMFACMAEQPRGPASGDGPLPTKDYLAGIFYIPQVVTKLDGNRFSYVNGSGQTTEDVSEMPDCLFEENGQWLVLRAVIVHWRGDGWRVYAYSVLDPFGWGGGDRFFSRNSSVLEPLNT